MPEEIKLKSEIEILFEEHNSYFGSLVQHETLLTALESLPDGTVLGTGQMARPDMPLPVKLEKRATDRAEEVRRDLVILQARVRSIRGAICGLLQNPEFFTNWRAI